MSDINHQDPTIEPELVELIQTIKATPERDPQAVARGFARFLAEVDQFFATDVQLQTGRVAGWIASTQAKIDRSVKQVLRPQRYAFSFGLAVLVVVFLLFSGAGVTAYAAQSALPGDALYSLKTGLERAQVRLVADAVRQVELHLDFAERRLVEISALIQEGRYGDIDWAAQEFEYHVQKALEAMQSVALGDPVRAQELALRITTALSNYAQALSELLASVPESARSAMQRALDVSESGREMHYGEDAENSNENEQTDNQNDNSDANLNQNENLPSYNGNEAIFGSNENDNANLNSNQNENDASINANQDQDDDRDSSNRNGSKDDNDNSKNSNDDRGGDRDNNNQRDNDNDHDDDNDDDNDNDHDNDNDDDD